MKDDGPGLSQEDVERILSEKVYDSVNRIADQRKMSANCRRIRGHGFGLMNCKGIIDKYKKTNEIFRVCLFRIESELGRATSRFLFPFCPKECAKTFDVRCSSLLFLSWQDVMRGGRKIESGTAHCQ